MVSNPFLVLLNWKHWHNKHEESAKCRLPSHSYNNITWPRLAPHRVIIPAWPRSEFVTPGSGQWSPHRMCSCERGHHGTPAVMSPDIKSAEWCNNDPDNDQGNEICMWSCETRGYMGLLGPIRPLAQCVLQEYSGLQTNGLWNFPNALN